MTGWATAHHIDYALQWGRVLMNAETAILGDFPRAQIPLQWGRVLMNAETDMDTLRAEQRARFNGAAFS